MEKSKGNHICTFELSLGLIKATASPEKEISFLEWDKALPTPLSMVASNLGEGIDSPKKACEERETEFWRAILLQLEKVTEHVVNLSEEVIITQPYSVLLRRGLIQISNAA